MVMACREVGEGSGAVREGGVGCFWVDLELLPRAVDTCAPKFVVVGGTDRVSAGGWGPGVGATYAG